MFSETKHEERIVNFEREPDIPERKSEKGRAIEIHLLHRRSRGGGKKECGRICRNTTRTSSTTMKDL